MPAIREIIAVLEQAYPPELAADWDAIGLTIGDPAAEVDTVLLAVDPAAEVLAEARDLGAGLIITHHPLFLRGVHSVATTTAKGRFVHEAIASGIALFSAHTNADHACPGVSDALADAIGLADLRPLVPDTRDPRLGTGRIGELSTPMTLREFAISVGDALPPTAHGVRVGGDPEAFIRTVAVCGGAGDSFLADAARVADAYVTSDLRHHRAADHLADGGCALVDVAHWAGEWPWLAQAARVLGDTVRTVISVQPTDPWTAHVSLDDTDN